jgi:hypothetical protein
MGLGVLSPCGLQVRGAMEQADAGVPAQDGVVVARFAHALGSLAAARRFPDEFVDGGAGAQGRLVERGDAQRVLADALGVPGFVEQTVAFRPRKGSGYGFRGQRSRRLRIPFCGRDAAYLEGA